MSTTINGVTVRFDRMESDWRKLIIIVEVASTVKEGLKAQQEIDPTNATGARHLALAIGAAGALGAEYLGGKYGDMVDPTCASRDAIRAFGEECRFMASLKEELPKKLQRIREHRDKLSAAENEVVERMCYLVNRDEALSRNEATLVEALIARIHGEQL